MKIIICGSISASSEIERVREELIKAGHKVEVPEGIKRPEIRAEMNAAPSERAEIKIKHNLIVGYYEKMKNYDVVLVVNPKLKGISGYIGGNTLIEMAFGLILNKRIYCLNPVPENMGYSSEILAIQPIVLNGDLSKLA